MTEFAFWRKLLLVLSLKNTYHEVTTEGWLINSIKGAVFSSLAGRQVKDTPDQVFTLSRLTLSKESNCFLWAIPQRNVFICAFTSKNILCKHRDIITGRITGVHHTTPVGGFLKGKQCKELVHVPKL